MKLASYKDGSRDGQLVVVSRDLSQAHFATGIATRLQQVLDDWNFLSPQLEDLSTALNQGRTRHAFAFEPAQCMAPIPRAYQWVRHMPSPAPDKKASSTRRGASFPLAWGASDALLGPTDSIVAASEKMGIDFEAGLAVITGDVPMGASDEQGLDAVRLVMLCNDICLQQLAEIEREHGTAALTSRPGTAFSPVAVTPDELGAAWREGRAHLSMEVVWNGKRVGLADSGSSMHAHFGQLIAQAAKTRPLSAGAIVGGGPLRSQTDAEGYFSIAHRRAAEAAGSGDAATGYMRFGDTVRIEARSAEQRAVFGAIEQTVANPLGE